MDLTPHRQAVARALKVLNTSLERLYVTHDDDEISMSCLGIAGVTADILKRAETVSTAKAALREICAPLQRVFRRIPTKDDAEPTKAIPVIRATRSTPCC